MNEARQSGTEGMAEGMPDGMTSEPKDEAGSVHAAERETFDRSMRDFAEGATALAAASLRLQMVMLEEMREMLGDMSAMAGRTMRDEGKDD